MAGEAPQPSSPARGMGLFQAGTGKLQRQLRRGEFDLFRHVPVFESDFIQITKRGEVIDVHNRVRMVTVGVACTSPLLPLPDVMLLARPAAGEGDRGRGRRAKALELTRLLPLKFVRVSVHDHEKQQLRLKFATGRSCYLQLCPAPDAKAEGLFQDWEKLVHLLRPPLDSLSGAYTTPARDTECLPLLGQEERTSPAPADDQDRVSVRSLAAGSEVGGATSAAFSGGENLAFPPDSVRSPAEPQEAASDAESATGTLDVALAIPHPSVPWGLSTDKLWEEAGSPRDSLTGPDIAQVAATCSQHSEAALVGLADQGPEDIEVVDEAGAGATRRAGGKTAKEPSRSDEDTLISILPESRESSEVTRVPWAARASRKARRERRERREKERRPRGSRHHRRAPESRHKAGSDKNPRKVPGGRPRRASGEDKRDRGLGSAGGGWRGPAHKGMGHAPTGKDSRPSHKSSRSLSPSSSSSTFKRLSRVSSFLRTIKVSLTARTSASLPEPEKPLPPLPQRHSMEVILKRPEDGGPAPAAGVGLVTAVTVGAES
ncbi:Golgi-associated RAB2 interactor protein 4 [Erinaceus europaeus]|uniref:Golgi-associated RAB2 interactor protein 4 n=1 Tax=Erinaceus europaeus TaxID=9365 RepID=A0A1S3AG39_ERIEU|nr:Golgi-associated RAB2 interactor protein 4 [Erinaceus europaeus]